MVDMAHLIEPVIPAQRRYDRTFVRDTRDADDLVQDTLERTMRRGRETPLDGARRVMCRKSGAAFNPSLSAQNSA